ncbi:CBS domain-containing protein [Caldimonas sp. KR1-144]|uniref:CBS domain-containing protein n=1 Tax=Caldimonas sp. KR1-144 TaxID=3400911 RepID=UPI003C11EFF9
MNLESLCQRELVTIDTNAPLRQAAVRMRECHVGALLVTEGEDQGVRAVGLVTDRDLAIEVIARDIAPSELRVGHIATSAIVTAPGSASVQEAVEVMARAGVRRLLVTDGEHGVIGLVSVDDLIDAISAELAGLARALRSSIARETSERRAVTPPTPRPVFLPQGTPGMASWSSIPAAASLPTG